MIGGTSRLHESHADHRIDYSGQAMPGDAAKSAVPSVILPPVIGHRGAAASAVVADFLARVWPPELPAPIISSFRQETMAAARARAPGIAGGMLFRAIPRNWRAIAERLGCTTIHADHQRLSPALVAEIHG